MTYYGVIFPISFSSSSLFGKTTHCRQCSGREQTSPLISCNHLLPIQTSNASRWGHFLHLGETLRLEEHAPNNVDAFSNNVCQSLKTRFEGQDKLFFYRPPHDKRVRAVDYEKCQETPSVVFPIMILPLLLRQKIIAIFM